VGGVEVLGSDPAHGDERWRARVGVVLQSWRDHAKWRVGELLAHLGSYYAGYSTERIERPWDADEFVFDLFKQYGEGIADLEVRRASLEDTYLALVRQAEAGQGEAAARGLKEVA
jgi:hypothetical protein